MTDLVRWIVGLALGVLTVPVVAGLVFVAEGATTLLGDPAPAGRECLYETDPGSGAGGSGVERVDRFPPRRTCVGPGLDGRVGAHRPIWGLDSFAQGMVVLGGVVLGCMVGGAVALTVISGRPGPGSSLVTGVASPT
ncbi:MAG TPA: hypothetical protein VK507_15200 [Iamia sp.]|nr:hypothetical protein [Iamia sp.]